MNISIDTAQNVRIDYTPAGIYDRAVATVIDFLALYGLIILLVFLLSLAKVESYWFISGCISLLLTYHLVFETLLHGKTPGKMAMNIQVVKLNGQKLSFWDCLLRWVFRLIDISICMGSVAMISVIVSKNGQRLGDLVAGTTVIKHHPKVTLQQIDRYNTSDDYEVTFSQASLLSDKDIHVIQDVLEEVEKNNTYYLLEPLAKKIKEVTGIETSMINLEFVQTILKDHNHLSKQ